MTFNDDANVRGSRTSKRGRNTAIGVGGGGLGLVAILLVSQLLGVDLTQFVDPSAGGGGSSQQGGELADCDTGADANENIDCRAAAAGTSLDVYWGDHVDGYVQPQLVIFDGATGTGCGQASTAVGPFYCPPDQTVYLDTAFYAQLRAQFGASAGDLAQLYVVAHEWGHHIQNLVGTMDGLDLQTTGPDSDGVRLELQADCYAGAWVGDASTTVDENGVTFLEPVTDAQIADALDAAAAVGDDSIQRATSGQVQPEGWTHGSSQQRQKWFQVGLNGDPGGCDTFAVAGGDL
jgi:predicted metalloprotease